MRRLPAFLLIALVPLAAAPALAQEAPSDTLLTVDHYLDWEGVSDPQISPDGRQVIYTRRWVDKLEDEWESSLWIMNADGSKNRFLVEGSNARWSPDGTRILYSAEGEPEGSQIFVRWMDDEGAASQVTRVVDGSPSAPSWSPDGQSIAFLMTAPPEEDEDELRIDLPKPPEGARWTKPPRIVESMHFRRDRRGWNPEGFMHLWVVPATGGTPRQLTKGDWNVGSLFGGGYDWTRDGRTIVFDGLRDPNADMIWGENYIYAVDVAGGHVRQITTEKGDWGGPKVSPDGRTIVFTGYPYTLQTYHVGELYAIGMDGSNMRKITPRLDRPVSDITWADDGSGFYFTVMDEGTANARFSDMSGNIREITSGEHMLRLSSIGGGTGVAVRSGPQEPGDIVRFDVRRANAAVTELTHVNDDVLARIRLGEVEEIWYDSPDGTRVQGWIVKPPSFDASRDYPMIMEIHGGPHGMYNVGFSYMYQNFAANGYVVLYTNPRGSTGYGTDFGNAIDNAYPSVDYDDLMAGVDALVARGYVDTSRMYVGGCSGGGVLSSWTIGHTDRFAAAAVRCPVINWISFAGTADIAMWGFNRYRPKPWEDPMKWLHHSPLMYAPNVKTPTLIMTGELDLRTPMGQSEEYFQALKVVGVPVKLVRFHDEYHGTSSKPSNFMRTQLLMMKWYQRWGGENRWRPVATGN